jgi:P4 family phage/plasmid primase-like protien
MLSQYQRVCDALGVTARGREVRVKCPAHGGDDKNMGVRELADGKVSLRCFSHGCSRDDILAGMGLTWRDLLPDNTAYRHGVKKRASKPTDKVSLEKFGDEDVWVVWDLVCSYLYLNEEGEVLYEKLRYRPEAKYLDAMTAKKKPKSYAFMRKAPNGNVVWGMDGGWHAWNDKRRRWEYLKEEKNHLVDNKPVDGAEWFDAPRRVLHDLPMLAADLREGVKEIWVCEGEPDAVMLRRTLGVSSTTADAGAGQWRREYTEFLAKFAVVVIVADRDEAGYKGAIRKRDALMAFSPAPGIRVVVPGEGKDAEEFLLKGGTLEGFVEVDPAQELEALEVEGQRSLDAEDSSQTQSNSSPSVPPQTPPSDSFEDESAGPPFLLHDLDLAEGFVKAYGANLRFCAKFGCWFRWDGVHWAEDLTMGSAFMDYWRSFAREQEEIGRIELGKARDREHSKQLNSKIDRVLGSGGKAAVMGMAKDMDPVPVTPDDLDQWPDLLPVANGTIDLPRGVLLPADPKHMFTGVVPIRYDLNAACPRWREFLMQVLEDVEMVDYIQVVVGYWLTGRCSEHKFWFLYGPPRSGKSTFVKIITKLLGKFSVNMMKKFLMKSGPNTSIDEHWARAKGKRIMTVPEVDYSDRLDESLVKQVTGEDMMTARRLHENSYDFQATFKMILIGNERPKVNAHDGAFWTRVLPVGFPNSIPVELQDEGLEAALMEELPGILLWAVQGAQRWYASKRLWVPQAVLHQIEEYKKEVDIIGSFLRSCTIEMDDMYSSGKELFDAYSKWCDKTNTFKINKNKFGSLLKQRTDLTFKKLESAHVYMGIQILKEEHWDYDVE